MNENMTIVSNWCPAIWSTIELYGVPTYIITTSFTCGVFILRNFKFNGISDNINISASILIIYLIFYPKKTWRLGKALNRSSGYTPAIIMIYEKQVSEGISRSLALNKFCTFNANNKEEHLLILDRTNGISNKSIATGHLLPAGGANRVAISMDGRWIGIMELKPPWVGPFSIFLASWSKNKYNA